jgi:hypothetical protein
MAWGGLFRSPRPDWMGIGHPLRIFTAAAASTRCVAPSGSSPVVARWGFAQILRRRRGGRQRDLIAFCASSRVLFTLLLG